MSSLKMTFSLASLVLIFALVFAAMPAMAADGGPTADIEAYSGKVDPNDATSAAYKAMRGDFKVKITFSQKITGFDQSDVGFQGGNADGRITASTGTANALVAVTTSNNTVFVATFLVGDASNDATEIAVTIDADAVTGDTLKNDLGNQRISDIVQLPPVLGALKVRYRIPKQ